MHFKLPDSRDKVLPKQCYLLPRAQNIVALLRAVRTFGNSSLLVQENCQADGTYIQTGAPNSAKKSRFGNLDCLNPRRALFPGLAISLTIKHS